jgi:hypothetical protein
MLVRFYPPAAVKHFSGSSRRRVQGHSKAISLLLKPRSDERQDAFGSAIRRSLRNRGWIRNRAFLAAARTEPQPLPFYTKRHVRPKFQAGSKPAATPGCEQSLETAGTVRRTNGLRNGGRIAAFDRCAAGFSGRVHPVASGPGRSRSFASPLVAGTTSPFRTGTWTLNFVSNDNAWRRCF